ncbi:protein GAMETOPHYTE DEFECTIVE 1 [Vigna angularis]|nr:protein GAMETOPHYTE DEFECTIVE 1 [Vigna angularis]
MGYFDLNIPYPQPSLTNKVAEQSNRTRLAVKAMELGYTGIAYNRTIKGVMSDQHRCSIAPLTLSSLLNVLPSLSLSANLHRSILGVPLSTPFRQYTRLTVCVDSATQAQALNSGNPILKTYDLIAVKPFNQTAFDLACQTMEVDIISIDFSAKLPFRLKQPMVKVAMQRGVCFEVTYSGLFADIQKRRQLISSAKLLMDWTRGHNIVFSSAAPTVNELRGPCDVANLLSLFGLSKERANAAISKNCRILLANSLRKKRFYKESIRVEVLSTDATSQSKEDRYQELLQWDPISSGEGDILLNDVHKSSLVSCKASKTEKAIDFTSVVNNLPSNGFEIRNILPANNVLPACLGNKVNSPPVTQKLDQSATIPNSFTEQSNILETCREQDENSLSDDITNSYSLSRDDIFEKNMHNGVSDAVNFMEINIPIAIDATFADDKINFLPVVRKINQSTPVPNNLTGQPDKLDVCPEQGKISQSQKQNEEFLEKNIHSGTTKAFNSMEMDISTNATKLKQRSSTDSNVGLVLVETKAFDSESNLSISSSTLNPLKPHENHKLSGSSQEAHDIVHEVEIFDNIIPAPICDKHYSDKSSDINLNEVGKIHAALPNEDLKTSISDTSMEEGKQFVKRHETIEQEKQEIKSYDEMEMGDNFKAASHLSPDVVMKDKEFGEVITESDQLAPVHRVLGALKLKRRTHRGLPLFPFKRLLNPTAFKRKVKKSKSRTKLN